MSKHRINTVLAVAAATASTVIGVAFQTGVASAANTPSAAASGWHVFTTVGPRHGNTNVANIVATGSTDAWSTWGVCSPCSGPSLKVTFRVERWNGRDWRVISVPKRLAKYASNSVAVGASSSRDAWLFNAGTIASKPLHWNGTRWSVHAIPAWVVQGNLSGTTSLAVADFGRAGMWVISQGQKSFQPTTYLAGFFDKGRWHKVKLPGIPGPVAAVSPTDVWALASPLNLPSHPRQFLMHWNGRRWRTLAVPKPTTIPPNSVESVSDPVAMGPRNVWLQRDIETGTQGARTLYLLHWNGKAWHRVKLGKPTTGVDEMARDGHGGLWLVANGPGRAFRWFFDHMSGGRWTRTVVPATTTTTVQEVTQLAWVPGTRSEWAAGGLLPVGSNVDVLGGIWRFRG
jgi:hypothetical protein